MKEAFLKTLVYADIFDYPLTAEELYRRKHGEEKTSRKVTERALAKLVDEGIVDKQEGFYFLPGRQKIVTLRKKRGKYAVEKIKIARRVANIIKVVPTVRLVGVTGSVAAGNADKGDDIDFFIISASGWLWTTRLLVTLILDLIGKRRRPDDKETKDKICLNLFVDEANLNVFDHNLFTAYELFQLKPLVDKNNIYQKFIAANSWVKDFLPNVFPNRVYGGQGVELSSGTRIYLDGLMRKIQLWWMRKRQTTEITEPNLIAFHPNDISQRVLEE